MKNFIPDDNIPPSVLASDLDGTLIPLPDNQQNREDLLTLKNLLGTGKYKLIFATGRHYESVMDAIYQYDLPQPDWIVCDVGSAVYHLQEKAYNPFKPYQEHLRGVVGEVSRDTIENTFSEMEEITLQIPEHQREFKISYECSEDCLDGVVETIEGRLAELDLPYTCMGSVDPFKHIGLVDILPKGVTKAYALLWLSTHADFKPDEVVYAGDSGNDYAALVSGFRAIVVANALPVLADKIGEELHNRDLGYRYYRSTSDATSGVLEGCRHYKLT